MQFARRTDHSTLTVRLSYDLTCEPPIARIWVPHAIVRNCPMIQEDRACGVRDCRRPRSVVCHAFHGAVQTISRSSPTHGLERRLVRFLRLHRATLCRFSCLIHEGCGPDPAGFSGPYTGVLCHPFEGHCCRPSAPDTSTTALAARKSTSCSLVGLSLGDRRSFGPLSHTYVVSFPDPHSELPVSLFSLVHRDRHSRPARAPVHAPAHLPLASHVASPITHTPARSESARLCAPRGGCCHFVVRSAGFSH